MLITTREGSQRARSYSNCEEANAPQVHPAGDIVSHTLALPRATLDFVSLAAMVNIESIPSIDCMYHGGTMHRLRLCCDHLISHRSQPLGQLSVFILASRRSYIRPHPTSFLSLRCRTYTQPRTNGYGPARHRDLNTRGSILVSRKG